VGKGAGSVGSTRATTPPNYYYHYYYYYYYNSPKPRLRPVTLSTMIRALITCEENHKAKKAFTKP